MEEILQSLTIGPGGLPRRSQHDGRLTKSEEIMKDKSFLEQLNEAYGCPDVKESEGEKTIYVVLMWVAFMLGAWLLGLL